MPSPLSGMGKEVEMAGPEELNVYVGAWFLKDTRVITCGSRTSG